MSACYCTHEAYDHGPSGICAVENCGCLNFNILVEFCTCGHTKDKHFETSQVCGYSLCHCVKFVPALPHADKAENAADILRSGADTFASRNKLYKQNVDMVGKVMQNLFTNGGATLRTANDYKRFHLLELLVVKLTRYTVNWEAGGHEDSMQDLMVYAAMIRQADAEAKAEGVATAK